MQGDRLSQAEKDIVLKLGECWNLFVKLPVEHPDDNDEFRRAIHDAQKTILSRPGRRQINQKHG